MHRVALVLATAALVVCIGRAAPGGGKTGLDDEGFITTWLLLAPIPPQGMTPAEALGREQIIGEAKLRRRAGDKVRSNGMEQKRCHGAEKVSDTNGASLAAKPLSSSVYEPVREVP